MRLDRIIQSLLPHDEKFFSFFDESAKLLVQSTELLTKLPTLAREQRIPIINQIHELEHQGDAITHNIFKELNSTFVTPFDREDIHLLASSLDDVLDDIDGVVGRMMLYKIDTCPPGIYQLSEILRLQTIELQRGTALLVDLRRVDDLSNIISKVNEYENQADDAFAQALADLFDTEKDPIQLIKLKEIFVALETATDSCDDVANVFETLLIKHA